MAQVELLFRALADSTRRRMLRVLAAHELSVNELVEVLEVPQSTVSRHLKMLREVGMVVDRRCGTTTLSATLPPPEKNGDASDLSDGANGGTHRQLSHAASDGAADLRQRLLEWAWHEPLDSHTLERIRGVLSRRSAGRDGFFESLGLRWDHLRIEAFGEVFHWEAFTSLLPDQWTVADIGTGTGHLLPVLARHFARVIAVEPAETMLAAARQRPELKQAGNVEFRGGSLEKLPIGSGELDLAVASLVLHHVQRPDEALKEIHRILRPDGRLLIIEQQAHENPGFAERMGDLWRGFEPDMLAGWVEEAGFSDVQCRPLSSARPSGRQKEMIVPALFTMTARAGTVSN